MTLLVHKKTGLAVQKGDALVNLYGAVYIFEKATAPSDEHRYGNVYVHSGWGSLLGYFPESLGCEFRTSEVKKSRERGPAPIVQRVSRTRS